MPVIAKNVPHQSNSICNEFKGNIGEGVSVENQFGGIYRKEPFSLE